jgi:hypothetical protein
MQPTFLPAMQTLARGISLIFASQGNLSINATSLSIATSARAAGAVALHDHLG